MDFLQQTDNIISKVDKIIKNGVKRSEDFVKITSLKLECVRINNDINNLYKQLGRSVYKMVKTDNADAELIEKAVIQIEGYQLRLANIKKKIEIANRIVTCSECGRKNKYIDIRCSNCGHSLFVTDESPDECEDFYE